MTGSVGPGWVMVTRTDGWQAVLIRWFTRSPVNHAAVHVGGGLMVEMMPAGAGLVADGKYPQATWLLPPATPDQLETIAAAARVLLARRERYGWADIAAQFAYRILHIRPASLARFIRSDRTMDCSASVDWCCQQAGVHLFNDGRLTGLVSPGDILDAASTGGWPAVRQENR